MRNCCDEMNDCHPSFKPYVCVNDLSKATQLFLELKGTENGIMGGNGHDLKFSQLTTLTVNHNIKLDPCCTSKIIFQSAGGLLDFLNADFSKDCETKAHQQLFLTGRRLNNK